MEGKSLQCQIPKLLWPRPPVVPKKGEMAKRLARYLVDSKEVLAGEMSASNLVLGLRFSCNDLDVVGEGTINNKRFLKCVLQLSSNTTTL